VSLTPVKLSADGSRVVDSVDSATIEVRVNTQAKLDSAGSDGCDRECNWGGLSLFIPGKCNSNSQGSGSPFHYSSHLGSRRPFQES